MQFRLIACRLGLSGAFIASALLATPIRAAIEEDAADSAQEDESARDDESVPVTGFAPPGVSVEQATDEEKNAAQELFLKGDEDFDVQDYERALEHFTASYSTVASPNSRLMIARCLLEIGRLDEAYDEYSGVMKDAKGNDDYETTGNTAQKEREALRHRLAWLNVKLGNVPEGSRLMVGGRERTSESLEEPIAVTPGKTAVKATTGDGQVAEATVHLAAGRTATVQMKLGETITVGDPPRNLEKVEKEPEEPQVKEQPSSPYAQRTSLKPYAYAAAGLGVLGFSGFAVLGTLSTNHYEALEEDCTDGICPASSQDDIDSGKQMQLFANVSLGVGIIGAAAAVTLFALDAKKNRSVDVQVGYQSLLVRGEF